MATSFSVADILLDVARTANVPDFTTTTNVTTAQITYRLVQSARSLSALFRQKLGEDQDFINQATLTVQAGVGLASLPTDCGEVNAVLWVRTASDWRLLESAGQDELEYAQTDTLVPWLNCVTPQYRIQGNVLLFLPGSSVAETVVIYYTKNLDLTGQTTFLQRVDADRWITLDLVTWILNAQGRHDQAQVFVAEKMALEANLFSSSRTRDPNSIDTIRDTRGIRGARRGRGFWNV